jgi:hypothetical protein
MSCKSLTKRNLADCGRSNLGSTQSTSPKIHTVETIYDLVLPRLCPHKNAVAKQISFANDRRLTALNIFNRLPWDTSFRMDQHRITSDRTMSVWRLVLPGLSRDSARPASRLDFAINRPSVKLRSVTFPRSSPLRNNKQSVRVSSFDPALPKRTERKALYLRRRLRLERRKRRSDEVAGSFKAQESFSFILGGFCLDLLEQLFVEVVSTLSVGLKVRVRLSRLPGGLPARKAGEI